MAAATFNTALRDKIFRNEGFREDMYLDQGGLPTIGYGFTKYSLTGKNGIPSWREYWKADGTPTGKKMTQEEADEIARLVTQEYIDQVNKDIKNENLTEDQYNSIVDLYYRNGRGNVKRSGVIELINDGKINEAADLIEKGGNNGRLAKVGGKVVQEGDEGYTGITNRNKRAADGLRSGVGASTNPEDVTVLGEVEVGGGRIIENLDPVGEGETVVEEVYASDNKNENIEEFERYTQTAYGDGFEVRQQNGRMVVVQMPVPEGEPEPTPNYEEVENVDEMNYTTYINQGRTIEPVDPPQPQVLDPEGNVVDQPTDAEGEAALREEEERQRQEAERQRQEEEAENQRRIIKRANDAKEFQELRARNKELQAAYKPEDMPVVFAREIRNNNARIAEIEEEYNLTTVSDEEYEARRAEIVANILIDDPEADPQDNQTLDEVLDEVYGTDEIEEEEEEVDDLNTPIDLGEVPSSQIPNDADVNQGVATWENEEGQIVQARISEIDDAVDPNAPVDETVNQTTTTTTTPTNNTVTTSPTDFMSTLGDIGNVVQQGLSIVDSVRRTINNQDDLILGALGQKAYNEAMKEITPSDHPELSYMFKQQLEQTRQLSKMGFSPEEAQAARANIDAAYGKGIENAVRGTAGNRAQFLAMSGVLDSQRSSALLDFAAKDAELNRRNQDSYLKALSFAEEYNLSKSKAERAEELQLELQKKKGASDFASKAFAALQQKADADRLTPLMNRYAMMLNNSLSSPYSNNPLTTPTNLTLNRPNNEQKETP
tara:strand:+ start:8058 stop:10379 length:2322 start_codon:yes stop_codon:yes gene_type:complete